MCRGHSYNGTWTEAGIAQCMAAFTDNYVFADDQALGRCAHIYIYIYTYIYYIYAYT